jgi:hypothetical protein
MRTGCRLGIVTLALAVGMVGDTASSATSKAAGRFNAAYQKVNDCTADPACERAAAGVAREIDRYVAGLLEEGRSAAEVNRALKGLRGYLPATEGKGVRMSCATFYSEPPRAAPSYLVAPLPGDPAGQIVGLFNFFSPGRRGPGHLSLFTKTADGWRRTAGFDSSEGLSATCLDHAAGCATLVVSEDFLGADRFELSISTWKVGAGSLVREPQHWDNLIDADLEQTSSGVRVVYTEPPRYIPEAFLGTRLVFQLDLTPGPGGTEASLTDLKPWLTAADLAFGAADGKRVVAPALRGVNVAKLRAASTVDRESGDLDAGRGLVALRDGEDATETAIWCLHVNRRADGVWRVGSVKKMQTCGGHARRKIE